MEIIIVIMIMGIVSVTAITKYIDFRQKAYEAQRDGIVSLVRGGLTSYSYKQAVDTGDMSFPEKLDSAPNGTCISRPDKDEECFSLVLVNGVTDGWIKFFGGILYQHADTNTWYWYRDTLGWFECIANCFP